MDIKKMLSENKVFLKSWIFIVFVFLVVFRLGLWLSIEWPKYKGAPVKQADMVVKIHNLPVRFMVYWPDSRRYWRTAQEIRQLFLLHFRDKAPGLEYFSTAVFFAFVRSIKDNIAYGVLAQNIISLLTAWILYLMLKSRGKGFAVFVVFVSFTNLLAISMEYAILREILARFFLVLSIYLVWRVCIAPNWGLACLSCIALFLLGWTRQELMVIPLIIIPAFFGKLRIRYIVLFLITGLLAIYSHTYFANRGVGSYLVLQQNLIAESYNYNSPDLGDLPKKIYNEAKKCKSTFKINCQFPSMRFQSFLLERDKVVQDWKMQNKDNPAVQEELDKMLFSDISKYNTKYIFYSGAYSLWSYFTGNLFTVSPFVYNGDNSQYKFGWPSYASTSVTRYGDPLSEINRNERGPTWLLAVMSPFSEYWYRKIAAPFFFLGLYFTFLMFFIKKNNPSSDEKLFWALAVLVSVTILLLACFVGVRTSRCIFVSEPFMIAISVLGMQIFLKKCTQLLKRPSTKELK